MIDSVGTTSQDSFKVKARQLLEGAVLKQQKQLNSADKYTDSVSLGNKSVDDATYSAPASAPATVSDVELGLDFRMLRELLATNLKEQGVAIQFSTGEIEIDIETITQEEATELVSDEGYFGVENTAQRMFDFAVKVAGDDPTRLDAIVTGMRDGFAQAEEAWGGTLPDISYETRDAIETKLKEWSGQDVELQNINDDQKI
ncbi:MAG: hypothetical protein OCC45_00150 [Desulfotalea sp.]